MDDRISKDEYFIRMADHSKERGTCVRAKVGCVLVDERGHILSTGYNGPPSGTPNCTAKNPCHPDAICDSAKSFTSCEAVHAEQNALLQCKDIYKIHTCYVTWSPCLTCTKLLMNTTCQRIVFISEYHSSTLSKQLWLESGKEWVQHIQKPL